MVPQEVPVAKEIRELKIKIINGSQKGLIHPSVALITWAPVSSLSHMVPKDQARIIITREGRILLNPLIRVLSHSSRVNLWIKDMITMTRTIVNEPQVKAMDISQLVIASPPTHTRLLAAGPHRYTT